MLFLALTRGFEDKRLLLETEGEETLRVLGARGSQECDKTQRLESLMADGIPLLLSPWATSLGTRFLLPQPEAD